MVGIPINAADRSPILRSRPATTYARVPTDSPAIWSRRPEVLERLGVAAFGEPDRQQLQPVGAGLERAGRLRRRAGRVPLAQLWPPVLDFDRAAAGDDHVDLLLRPVPVRDRRAEAGREL